MIAPARSKPDPRLASAPWLLAADTQRIFEVIEAGGYTVRAVGGTVRNTLLGEPVSDIDLATDALPDDVAACARKAGIKVIPTGIAHGTVTLILAGTPFEVTTLRRDVSTDGRRASVAFTDNWAEDAARRDFTINAIYCDRSGILFDPVGGIVDVGIPRVRFIGDAQQRIREDYLRILRFFRFSAQYAKGELDPEGFAACICERDGLKILSAERIHHELLRLLAAPYASRVIERMSEHGFLADLLGSATDAASLDTIMAFEEIVGARTQQQAQADPLLRLAALAVRDDGDVARLKRRLKLSNAEVSRLSKAVAIRQSMSATKSAAALRAGIYRHGNTAVLDALALSAAKAGVPAGGSIPLDAYRSLIDEAAAWHAPTLPVSGKDILALGVPAGPAVSGILSAFETWWIAENYPADGPEVRAKLAAIAANTKS